jgi:hypothetical protein
VTVCACGGCWCCQIFKLKQRCFANMHVGTRTARATNPHVRSSAPTSMTTHEEVGFEEMGLECVQAEDSLVMHWFTEKDSLYKFVGAEGPSK